MSVVTPLPVRIVVCSLMSALWSRWAASERQRS
jgi:hypothetical protein